MTTPHIAIDFSSLDQLNIGNGLYRYVVDLVQGLVRLPVEGRFTLLGSRPEPVEELGDTLSRDPRWQYVPIAHATGRGGYLRDQYRYPSLCGRLGIELLHATHTSLPVFMPCRTVVTEHDLMFDLFDEYQDQRQGRQHRLYRLASRRATRIIAISRTTADDLVRLHGFDPERIDVVYHGSSFCGAPPLVWPPSQENAPFLLSPYNLEPRKNMTGLLAAFQRLRARFPRLQLKLFGRAAWTPEREHAFERTLLELGLASHALERLGFVSDDELRNLYRTCRLFVFPSLYEGFGLPLLEAMASSACVVARNQSAMAEVVGPAGVLADTTNPDLFADAIAGILQNEPLQTSLRWAAYRRAQLFSIERMATQTLRTYYAALELPAPAVLTSDDAALDSTSMKPALSCTT